MVRSIIFIAYDVVACYDDDEESQAITMDELKKSYKLTLEMEDSMAALRTNCLSISQGRCIERTLYDSIYGFSLRFWWGGCKWLDKNAVWDVPTFRQVDELGMQGY